jgi:hypothetical protein
MVRIDCANGACAPTPYVPAAGSYAYAPADIDYQGAHHLFMCSTGIPNVSFDSIRYINDRDQMFTVMLNVLGYSGSGTDMSACDPEVVSFGGYFYLFYGSSMALNPQEPDKTKWVFTNVIHVARAATIEGPYQILDQNGTWQSTTDNPKAIITSHVLAATKSQQNGGYIGASWPSVVVRGNKISLWYYDDTLATPLNGYYYYLESTDPSQWNTSTEVQTDINSTHAGGEHSGEVKFDPQTNMFVMFSVYSPHTPSPWLGVRTSADGLHWSQANKVSDLPGFSHNVGVESDEQGSLPYGPTFLVNFGAPTGLANNLSWAQWNLYSLTVSR